jgi:hypothetical protein
MKFYYLNHDTLPTVRDCVADRDRRLRDVYKFWGPCVLSLLISIPNSARNVLYIAHINMVILKICVLSYSTRLLQYGPQNLGQALKFLRDEAKT